MIMVEENGIWIKCIGLYFPSGNSLRTNNKAKSCNTAYNSANKIYKIILPIF